MTRMKQIVIDVDVNRVIEANRSSFSEKENDILRRLLLERVSPEIARVTQLDVPKFGSRNRGHWQVKFGEEVASANSLKDAYCKLILLAYERDPAFLDRFSTHKGRMRRYVARDPKALYPSSPHLAKDHAIMLVPGWYLDGNLSETQVSARIRAAAREAGFAYGHTVWIKNGGRTI